MFGWLKSLTKNLKTRDQWAHDTASNIYDALVLDGGPGGNTKTLDDFYILDEHRERFESKNLKKMEMFVYFSFFEKKAFSNKDLINDLSIAFTDLLRKKWKDRGFDDHASLDAQFEAGFKSYELFTTNPTEWAHDWMTEFFLSDDVNKKWAAMLFLDHSLKQQSAINDVIEGLLCS